MAVVLLVLLPIVTMAENPPSSAPPPTIATPTGMKPPVENHNLILDPPSQTYNAVEGQQSAAFTFHVKNISSAAVVIDDVKTSCGCTVAELPSKPWTLAAGITGEFRLTVDLRGKYGALVKSATLETAEGTKVALLRINVPLPKIPSTDEEMRAVNLRLAQTDRQAVFKGDCVRCHVEPAKGMYGEALFHTMCGVCHEAEHRGSMVPDLAKLDHPTDREFWKAIITSGKPGTLMPAFAQSEGGPLSAPQIDGLTAYLAAIISPSLPSPSPAAAPKKP